MFKNRVLNLTAKVQMIYDVLRQQLIIYKLTKYLEFNTLEYSTFAKN